MSLSRLGMGVMRGFGGVLTVLVVVGALAGYALFRELGGAELEDRGGLVDSWEFLTPEEGSAEIV